ncbi:MAG: NAD(P)/FAD-dependent oxidoreductase [Proteobacteria bacterium]|nr:NAD(P)/FAD-dependent oxidoreductase [Pseudomonadota bacterium]
MAEAATKIRPRVLIVGAGFGGLSCARALKHTDADITIVDRNNHHCFQPLLYQVATAALTPSQIAWPIRALLRGQANATTYLAELDAIDLQKREASAGGLNLSYDYLVLATGATHSYFGHDDWERVAPGLKHVDDATAIRRRILMSFEEAELTQDAAERVRLLTFVIVGAGPTGVEMAGAIAEIARHSLNKDFRHIDPQHARIMLIEGAARVLPAYPERLSSYAALALARKGVDIRAGVTVTGCDARGVDTSAGRIEAATTIWAAGVRASPVATWLGAAHDRAGRVLVQSDLSLSGHREVFVIGDAAIVKDGDGKAAPGIAPAAKQMGQYVARAIRARIEGREPPAAFTYRHYGDLATIGRNDAVVNIPPVTLTGFMGWAFWSVAHIYFLIGARNRIAVAFNWLWDYLTYQRGVRLILGARPQD